MSGTRSSQSKQDKEDNGLILYRLTAVESAVRELTSKFDKLDNIKKDDLKDFQNTLIARITDIQNGLQKQIDEKASGQDFKDFKKQVSAAAAFLGALFLAAFSYMLTRLK